MANFKTGLAYYNVDTDRYQDIKIKRLKKDFGCKGIAIYDYILCQVYRDKGCFLAWDENTAFDVADYFGEKETLINEIVQYCGVVGLFNKELLACGIVTSLSIQNRYIDMCNRAQRKNAVIPKNIKISEQSTIISEESKIISEESTIISEVCDKVKYSKEKNSVESTNIDSMSVCHQTDVAETVDYKKFVEFFNTETKGVFGLVKYPLGEKRKASIRARVREHGKQALTDVIKKAAQNNFLKGDGRKGFQATFDWIIKPSNFEKIMSGNYDKNANAKLYTGNEFLQAQMDGVHPSEFEKRIINDKTFWIKKSDTL